MLRPKLGGEHETAGIYCGARWDSRMADCCTGAAAEAGDRKKVLCVAGPASATACRDVTRLETGRLCRRSESGFRHLAGQTASTIAFPRLRLS